MSNVFAINAVLLRSQLFTFHFEQNAELHFAKYKTYNNA